MPVDIAPGFSVYQLIERIQKQSAILNHRRTMSLISFEIENATLIDEARTRIFAGFQQMSKFLPQVERYTRLAQNAESIYVCGIPDVTPPEIPNITYINLKPTDQLAREWFLVSYGKEFASTLATEELTTLHDPDDARVFKGIWTFDVSLTSILEEWLTSTVDAKSQFIKENDHNPQRQTQLASNIMNRLLRKVVGIAGNEHAPIIQGELKTIIKENIYPLIARNRVSPLQGSHPQDVVVMFSDLRNFSTVVERMNSRELVEKVLNPYLSAISRIVQKQGGTVDKLMGDGVLAIFGSSGTGDDKAEHALNAAKQVLDELAGKLSPYGVQVGIGMASGSVLVGTIGSDTYSEQTVMGDAVNIAQRLSQFGNNDVWISHTVYEKLNQRAGIDSQGALIVNGKSEPHLTYRFQHDA